MPNARLDDMLAEILAHDLAESRLRTMALQIIHILAEQNCHCGIKAITDSALHAERAISAPNAEAHGRAVARTVQPLVGSLDGDK